MNVLEATDVHRVYATTDAPALRGVSLKIQRGEFVAIVGPSGAGKSTFLNLLGLLDTPSSGELRINGVETSGLTEGERDRLRSQTFGFVFQDSFVLPEESVARNVALPLRMRGILQDQQVDLVSSAIDQFGLIRKSSQLAGTLSGGERQRVAFARAVAGKPVILLADEPTGNLDSENTRLVLGHLEMLNASGVTVIVVTHSDEVARVAERVVRVEDGQVVSDQSVASQTPATVVDCGQLAGLDPAPKTPRTRSLRGWHLPEALTSLLLAPVRSFAILVAFVVAISGLVVAANLTATAADQVSETLSAAALDEVVVRLPNAGASLQAAERATELQGVLFASRSAALSESEATLRRYVGDVTMESAVATRIVDDRFLATPEVSVWPEHATALFSASDGSRAAILGPEAATSLGIAPDAIGDEIEIAGQPVTVVGHLTGAERDPTLLTSVLVSQADFVQPANLSWDLTVRTQPGLPARIAEALPLAIDPAHPESAQVRTVADIRTLTKGVNADLALTVLLVSVILLMLVCLTSSISMFLTVISRTREIALRRAVGATRRDIRALFLTEGTLIGLAGSLAGVALGVGATVAISVALGWSPSFDMVGAALAILAGVAAGSLSAVIPSRRAARIEPALALKAV
ncbi:ATP-binding cassette domain-containing protein [Pseudoclavibacter sp. VKM Ac-2867]|uniref:ABC transporter ATP-binding protein/permease n=1 Tax=Pseudoclavibacter sp. VKM Ac-2867 TaxID=2783829 RepID=UPI00188B4705|nr:ABC transporter ATP-binding protein/permease [Pseudoclavibacter sp. VKM Ac-2867]MBF4457440.1 ATP-binding cassette domain-containing protein [Pseudoclavibacter sp. VKM Ac-2867]